MAKRSRKTRQTKSVQSNVTPPPASTTNGSTTNGSAAGRNGVNFANDYYYVYADMRTMFIVTILMVVVVFGLSYII